MLHLQLTLNDNFFSRQDKVEEADSCGIRAAGRSWELFSPSKDVPLTLFLSPEPAEQYGQHDRGCCCSRHVQQYVQDSPCTPSPTTETISPQGTHTWPGTRGTTSS